MSSDNPVPEDRLDAAITVLTTQGRPITPITVRAVTGAPMTACAATVAAWQAKQDGGRVHRVPEAVQERFATVWAEAYRAAVDAVIPERDALVAQIRHLRAEVTALETAVVALENERDQAVALVAQAQQETGRDAERRAEREEEVAALLDELYAAKESGEPPEDWR